MLIKKTDVEKALKNYKQKINKNLFFRFASTPSAIKALSELITPPVHTNNGEKQSNTEFSKEEFLQLIRLLLEIEWRSHWMGYFDSLYRCLNSYELLVKALGNDGKNKTEHLKKLYIRGLVEDEDIDQIVSLSFFNSETPDNTQHENKLNN